VFTELVKNKWENELCNHRSFVRDNQKIW
jgi:hypothetical protein